MSGENESRRRLRPWLEAKINSGTIPGLYWVDEEKTMFQVPWKHAGKQDWSPDQSTLFMEWAKHTGRYREGVDEPDYATWKTRLRCAFNKAPDIEEMKSMTDLDAAQPYRVYKFLPKKSSKRLPGLNGSHFQQENHLTSNFKMEPMELNLYVQQANLNPKLPQMLENFNKSGDQAMSISGSMPSDLKNIPSQDILRPSDGTAQLEHLKKQIAEGDQNMDCAEGLDHSMVDKRHYQSELYSGMQPMEPSSNAPQFIDMSSLHDSLPDSAQGACSAGASVSESTQWFAQHSPNPLHQSQHLQQQQQLDYLQTQLSPSSHSEMSPSSVTHGADFLQDEDLTFQTTQLHCQLPDVPAPPNATICKMLTSPKLEKGSQLHIVIRYFNNEVGKWCINNPDGCRIFYSCDRGIQPTANSENIELPAAQMEEIKLPTVSPNQLAASVASQFQMLLGNLERGLLLQSRNGDIYAKRLCKCKIFYSTSSSDENCMDMQRNEWVKIFDYIQFKQGLAYRSGISIPSTGACLLFGQRTAPGQSPSKILISTEVTSGLAAIQLHMAGKS